MDGAEARPIDTRRLCLVAALVLDPGTLRHAALGPADGHREDHARAHRGPAPARDPARSS